jgi:NADPH2:quinone reductase
MSTSAAVSIPSSMKAAVIDAFGPPEVVHTAVVPVPELGPNEVLIRVGSAGVGAWDPELCAGEFGADAGGFPRVLGSDGAGTVAAVGSNARRFRVGDGVYAWGFLNPKGGFYAEYAAIAEDEVSTIPGTLSVEEAGALAVDGLTALAGLDRLQLARDHTLMILGASGGVGHLALQLAKRLGARVLAVASGDDGVELVGRLGADAAVEGRSGDIATMARAFASRGVDAALVLSGARIEELLGLVRPGGRVAYPNGVEPEPQPRSGIVVEAFDGYHGREALERLDALVGTGPFHVVVSQFYPMGETAQALRDVKHHHLGKLAVRVP